MTGSGGFRHWEFRIRGIKSKFAREGGEMNGEKGIQNSEGKM